MKKPEGMSDEDRAASSGAGPAMAPPAGSPNAEEQPRQGDAEQAKANVQIAIGILEQALPTLGATSEEGKAVVSALSSLARKFTGKKSEDLAPAELIKLISGMPDAYKQQAMKELAGGEMPQAGM